MARGMREVLTPGTALDGAHRTALDGAHRTVLDGGSRTMWDMVRRMVLAAARSRTVQVMAPGRGKDSSGMEPGTIRDMVHRVPVAMAPRIPEVTAPGTEPDTARRMEDMARRMARVMAHRADRGPGRDSRMVRILEAECRPTARRATVPMGQGRTEGMTERSLLLSS